MSEYIYKASNVDEAIKIGLENLRLKEDDVKIEVLEAGNTGLFGFFKKEASVKLIPLDPNYKKEILKTQPKVSAVPKHSENELIVEKQVEKIETIAEEISKKEEIIQKEVQKETRKKIDRILEHKEDITNYVTKIVHAMGFKTANLEFIEEGNKNYTLRITGVEATSLLIGKRGNTLNAIQYLANNYAKKYTKHYFRINMDCDEYRENRKETLEELAINMAKKSKKLGKAIELEPMTASERKIIHNALSDIKNVETESFGKEPHRYLVIRAK